MKHIWVDTIRVCCALLLLTAFLCGLISCNRNGGIPDGAYSCIEADTGEMYTFCGKEVWATLFIMGNVTENHVGTYRAEDGKITMNFPTDSDKIYTGTFDYTLSEDGKTLVLAGIEFKKEVTSSETGT